MGKVRILFHLCLFQILLKECSSSISLDAVVVPTYKLRGDNATLLCNYRTKPMSLYSLKWYKDEQEFYRFEPWNINRQEQSFPVKGITVDMGESEPSKIRLRKVNFMSSGIYRCEITSKDFEIYEKYEQMTVIELPKKAPTITTINGIKQYEVGDMLQLNCTSEPSNPAADLKWEINKELVPDQHYIFNEQIVHGREGKLYVSRIGLQIRLSPNHFHWGKLKVACIGEIKAVFWARGVENIYIEQPIEQYKVLESSEGYWIANSGEKLRCILLIPAFLYSIFLKI
ncbi:uncharacterized protein LOC111700878 [Eurytemora carolleeae]|uniref:uncharacterized protein LOC111700878 n=1 Tax=Eurytemora carolleeae TaxID=1294199 RepID=UPI000C76186A|nr:uncharacterized protein LOC111700878 [Eurytemora carolleeae]|eukprot:XP_023327713.1 uncharacterized protein LOC111700878 [Eurytemora affinis]